MAYESRKKKISTFAVDDALTDASTLDFIKNGINKKTSWANIRNKLSEVFGLSARIFSTEADLIASDIAIGEHAIVEENNTALYKITSLAANSYDVTLTSGFTASLEGPLLLEPVADYTALRAINTKGIKTGQTLSVTNSGIAGSGVLRNVVAHGLTDNGGTIIVISADFYWERPVTGEFYVTWFGATGNGTTDDTAAIQLAVDACSAFGGGDVLFPDPANNYRIESTVNVPVDVNLIGVGRFVYFAVRAGTYAANSAFLCNTTDGVGWVSSNPNNRSSIIRGLRVETEVTTLVCFTFSGSHVFEDLAFKFFEQSIVGSATYNDLIKIDRVTCSHTTVPASYQVEFKNTGDAVHVNQLHCFPVNNDPNTPLRGLKVQNNAVSVTNYLGGDIELVNCTALTSLKNIGMDGGKIILDKSSCTLEDVALSALENEAVIEFRNDTSFTRSVSLRNITISHDIVRGAWEPYQYDVRTANGFVIEFDKVYRRILASDNPSSRNLMGINVENEGGSPLTDFNKYSHFYSTRCVLENEKLLIGTVDHPLPQSSLNLFSALVSYASDSWEEASGTYYYRLVPYWDVDRAVSRGITVSERSLALTNAGDAALLEISASGYSSAMIIRAYRGTSTGSYDAYADVAVVDSPSLVDNGNTISGVAWTARAAGPIDSTNALNLGGFKASTNGLVNIRSTAVPAVGTWTIGDTVENTILTPDANDMINLGWKRITTGSGNVLGTDWVPMYISTVSPAT